MFIPLKMVLIGIDPYPYIYIYIHPLITGIALSRREHVITGSHDARPLQIIFFEPQPQSGAEDQQIASGND